MNDKKAPENKLKAILPLLISRWSRRITGVLLLMGTFAWAQERPPGRGVEVRHLIFRLGLREVAPRTMTVPEGWYYLRLINGVITSELDVRLIDDKGSEIKRMKAKARSARTASFVHLHPGKHVLSISGNAGWRAEIEVTPAAR